MFEVGVFLRPFDGLASKMKQKRKKGKKEKKKTRRAQITKLLVVAHYAAALVLYNIDPREKKRGKRKRKRKGEIK